MLGVRYALLLTGTLASTIHGTAAAEETVPTQSLPSAPASPSAAAASDAAPAVSAQGASPPSAPAASPPPPAAAPQLPATETQPRVAGPAPTSPRLPPASAPPFANWNIGAGLGANDSAYYGVAAYGISAPSAPSYHVGFERRIHRNSWLTFTGSFTHSSYDLAVQSQLDPPTRTSINYQTTGASAMLGIRQAFDTDVVEFSLFAAAVGAWFWTGGDVLDQGETIPAAQPGGFARTLGFTSGIAVERKLIERLSVRLSSEIFSLAWSKSTPGQSYEQSTGEEPPPETHHSQTTSVHVSPAIDLRFYF